jgi:cytolethal distending toxin subunit A
VPKLKKEKAIMTILHRATTAVVMSSALALGLVYTAAPVFANDSSSDVVMLANTQTGKCLTIAGGRSTENNVVALQYNCDRDPSRRWILNEMSDGYFKIQNVQTGKCLTIAGGSSTDNNVETLQYNCDRDPSRRWYLDQLSDGTFKIQNVKTAKCLTIAGGRSTDNNVHSVQYNCDRDPSRTWRIIHTNGQRLDDN